MPSLLRKAIRRYREDGLVAVLGRAYRYGRRSLDARRRAVDLGWTAYNVYSRRVRRRTSQPFLQADWDNLVILDACNFEVFRTNSDLPGTLSYRYSPGSSTSEFLEKTVVGRSFPDTVCVTANPKYTVHDLEDNFHETVSVWRDSWDDQLRTVPPSTMRQEVQRAADRWPDKRILAHFIQPHSPFIGDIGQAIDHDVHFDYEGVDLDHEHTTIWQKLREDVIDSARVEGAYLENLQLTLPHVRQLLETLPGKTVVTSDHGNVFGQYGLYGHPVNRHCPPLIQVPWLEYTNGDRKEITVGETGSTDERARDEQQLRSRLANLGYVDT